MIIARYDAILDQSERAHPYNHLGNYTNQSSCFIAWKENEEQMLMRQQLGTMIRLYGKQRFQLTPVLAGNLPFSAIISGLPLPLVTEGNVFPASLVFLARSFVIFLMYLGLFFLPLGHSNTSPRFFGRDSAVDCLDFVRGLYYISLASKYHYQQEAISKRSNVLFPELLGCGKLAEGCCCIAF